MHRRAALAALTALLLLPGCAQLPASTGLSAREILRPAEDTPPSFVTEDDTTPVDTCRNPLIDPRDQTRLRLIRSANIGGSARGDYEVPAGRYGVRDNELLRIDCASGQALGVVRS